MNSPDTIQNIAPTKKQDFDPSKQPCKYGLSCSLQGCKYSHEMCRFGLGCNKSYCKWPHPTRYPFSPALVQHQQNVATFLSQPKQMEPLLPTAHVPHQVDSSNSATYVQHQNVSAYTLQPKQMEPSFPIAHVQHQVRSPVSATGLVPESVVEQLQAENAILNEQIVQFKLQLEKADLKVRRAELDAKNLQLKLEKAELELGVQKATVQFNHLLGIQNQPPQQSTHPSWLPEKFPVCGVFDCPTPVDRVGDFCPYHPGGMISDN